MKTHLITSRRDASQPQIWITFNVADNDTSVTVSELNGVVEFRKQNALRANTTLTEAQLEALKQRELQKETRFEFALSKEDRGPNELPSDPDRPELADEVHVFAVTLDGELVFVPSSRQEEIYYAHLGWYDPKNGEWEVLTFVDESKSVVDENTSVVDENTSVAN